MNTERKFSGGAIADTTDEIIWFETATLKIGTPGTRYWGDVRSLQIARQQDAERKDREEAEARAAASGISKLLGKLVPTL